MGEVIQFPRRHSTEPTLPILLAARELGVTLRTLRRWIADGCPDHDGRVRLSEVRRWKDERRAS